MRPKQLLAQLVAAEYSAQLAGGVPMTQVETIRPADFGVAAPTVRFSGDAGGEDAPRGHRSATRAGARRWRNTGLDADLELIRDQFRKFADAEVVPHAHGWHMRDELIPIEILQHMGELGVFGLTIPEKYGGSGLGKTAMCVVSEELSRGYIGVGSLGTRSEIAAELILTGGTAEQKAHWLPKIASAEILPTAVFTEPNTGSDLASLKTRAVREGDDYVVTGNKTWITHAARADLMTLLVRTDRQCKRSPRAFHAAGGKAARRWTPIRSPRPACRGGEIEVLGYRGMKEYEIGFDGFRVPADEPARRRGGAGLQAADGDVRERAHPDCRARRRRRAMRAGAGACATRWSASNSVRRFSTFPRVANKLAMMAAEIMARAPDRLFRGAPQGLQANAATSKRGWPSCSPRASRGPRPTTRCRSTAATALRSNTRSAACLCDARILNIFEGAGEIQAQVIGRRLLEESN